MNLFDDRLPVKFWDQVIPIPFSGCWLWLAAAIDASAGGYGVFRINGKQVLSHRLAFETLVSKIPDGLQIDHLCKLTRCVNPSHMEAVSLVENVMRGESPCARHARQTHCKRGHPFSADNTYFHTAKRGPQRQCKICRYNRNKKIEDAKRAAI